MTKLLFFFLPITIFAQSFMLSSIPLPKTYIQNLDPYECDETCMQDFLNNDMVFSFIAHSNNRVNTKEHTEAKSMFVSIFNLGSFTISKEFKIALLLPYKIIGKYASSTTNTTFAYLITKSHPFMLKSYKIESEDTLDVRKALDNIIADGFEYVIAPMTKKGVQAIIDIDPPTHIYFPTINKNDINTSSKFLSFGAIDYGAQNNLLLKESVSPLVIISDKSTTGRKLSTYQKNEFLNQKPVVQNIGHIKLENPYGIENNETNSTTQYSDIYEINEAYDTNLAIKDNVIVDSYISAEINETTENNESNFTAQRDEPLRMMDTYEISETTEENIVIDYFISKKTTNLERYLKENKKITNASFFINTPIIKSGMIMSQLTLYDVNSTNILSTQINYDPLLLSMTQFIDRKNMIVANSITEHNGVLTETNSLLGNDIRYDWINYTTTVGVDYFYSLSTGEDRAYIIKIEDNQMIYETELIQPSKSKFITYTPLTKDTYQ